MTRFYMMFLLCLTAIANAQLPHTLTQVARNLDSGDAYDIAFGGNNIIFLANGFSGLRAYEYDGNSLT
ncbi:MAG: hypothetical protein KDE57_15270, partial [Calditrichaeota bacterium]|nr:hypothetical protein [Calditrichota bacterium]